LDYTASIHSLDDEAAQARWRALWEISPQRSSFSSLPYARAATAAFGLECEMYLVTAAGRDEAGCLAYWRKRGPYRTVVTPPFTQYAPLLLRTSPDEARVHARHSALETLLATLETQYATLALFVPLTDVRPAQWRGWRVTPFYTYLLDLQESTLPDDWSRGTRHLFRKHGGTYRIEDNPDAASVARLCAASYARHGRPCPADPANLTRLMDVLRAEGLVHLLTATPCDCTTLESGLAVLHDGHTAHYWIAGSLPGPAMTVLLGKTLFILRDAGLQRFDFVGANMPSIAEFKRHFGPVLTPYYYLEKITRP
jgi:hypothetical protein